MLAVGIDLGTTHSLISVLREDGSVDLLTGVDGSVLTPSVVGVSDDQTLLIGSAAQARLISSPKTAIAAFKRTIGTSKLYSLGTHSYGSSELSAFVLCKLKEHLESHYPEATIGSLVISVPAYFNSTQREATMFAAELAGLPRPHLINEPTAAAMAYGVHEKDTDQTIMVLDLGGGTFDVSIVEMFEGVMEVRSSAGDTQLGGEDFTQVVANDIQDRHAKTSGSLSYDELSKIKASAEVVKRRLSIADHAEVTLNFCGQAAHYDLSRSKFEEICGGLLLRMRRPIEQALYDAQLNADEIDRLILVGGATRMTMVRTLAARLLRKLPEAGLDPDQIIACGAAVQAGLVSKNAALSDMVMTDVAPFTLGIKSDVETRSGTLVGGFSPIIERNTILPASRVNDFWTIRDGQTEINVEVYQGESPMAADNVKIGEKSVPVPPNEKGRETIAVRFSYDTSGLLQVDVTVNSTGEPHQMVIEGNAATLSDAEKQDRLKALEAYKMHPREDEENIALMERLKGLYAMLLGEDRVAVTDLIAEFEQVLGRQDPRAISRYRNELIPNIEGIERAYVR